METIEDMRAAFHHEFIFRKWHKESLFTDKGKHGIELFFVCDNEQKQLIRIKVQFHKNDNIAYYFTKGISKTRGIVTKYNQLLAEAKDFF